MRANQLSWYPCRDASGLMITEINKDRLAAGRARYARLSSSTGMVRTPSVWRAYSAKPG